ncbi:Phosphotransferase enzyme family protein [Tolypocladium paradoxum]|uniref:Phosphotransferase enzyme family protein n=1 Tax=Tolypocladium paradoxum TaxID=94208 RepID=A0A2S4KPX2_9HYPO|nr:Phosphotransferase enzyme family protein [Tolypocladium paradoxum]
MPRPQIPSRDAVLAACKAEGAETKGLVYNDQIWIKYGATVRMAEAAIQRYVYENADPSIVRIPQVFDAFSTPPRPDAPARVYIIMEYVKDDDYVDYNKQHPQEAAQALEAIATAVRHIWDIPLPPNASVGPFEQQVPVDRFFADFGAGQVFNELVEIEDWINHKLEDARRPDRVSLQGERLCLCHCDLTQFNIKVGERITILDWGFAGIYTRAFDEFALIHQYTLPGHKFAKALRDELFGPKFSKSMRAFCLAARYHAFGC